jgi:protein tyrosine/serine phosphatase
MGLYHVSNTLIWDRFDTVKPGVLYRSGQLSEVQLREAIKRYGIRTVVNFQVKDKSVEQESAIAKELGISFMNLPMPGDGFGQEEQFREVLKAVDDPDQRPLLIHCARGTCRTGAAVALYRFERDGWSIDDVSDEMLRQSYKPGWLSGYIYGMLDRTPNLEFRDPVEKAQALSVPNVPKAVVGHKEPVSPEVRR